jgi:hypothetical protein
MKWPATFPDLRKTCLVASLSIGTAGGALSQETAVAFAPGLPPLVPDPAGEAARQAEEAARREAEDRAARMRLFVAIADNDRQALSEALSEGMDPNVTLPVPADPEFVRRFTDERLNYYLTREQNFTALMLAASLGHLQIVRDLLLAGADPWRMTKKHRTYALWLAAKYRHLEIMRSLMGIGPEHESASWSIEIDLAQQKAWVWHQGRIVLFMPISSGRKSHPTPKGEYLVTDKYRTWKSTLYDAKMPYFLRLSCGDFGLHEGVLPGYPASHGCIRLPKKAAKELFQKVPIGTLVVIR